MPPSAEDVTLGERKFVGAGVKSKEVASATIPGRFIFRARHRDSGGVSDRHLAKRFSPISLF